MQTNQLSRRTLLKWMGVGAAGMALAACAVPQAPSGSGAAAQSGAAAPAKQPVEIGWARHGAETDLATENALADLFHKNHPDVVVKPLVLPWDDYNTKIPVMVAGGTAPDTFGAHPALLKATYDAKGLIPIDSYIEANAEAVDYEDVLYPGDALFDGKIMGLPQKSCTHQLRYNKKIFEEAGLPTPADIYKEKGAEGWTWNTFVEMGKQLTKDLDGDGQSDQYFFSGVGGTEIVDLIRSNGGELFNADLTTCTLTEQAAVEAIKWIGDLVLTYKIQPPPELQANEIGINFQTGRIALQGATTCDHVRDLRPGSELPFEWGFVPLPAGSAGFRVWGDTDQIIITSSSKNPDSAFDWMLYRNSKQAWEDTYAGGIILAFSDGPTRKSIFQSKAFTEPLGKIDLSMIEAGYNYTIPNPYVPRVPDPYRVIFTIMPTEVDNVQRGVKSAEQAAADMCALIQEVLAGGSAFTPGGQCYCQGA